MHLTLNFSCSMKHWSNKHRTKGALIRSLAKSLAMKTLVSSSEMTGISPSSQNTWLLKTLTNIKEY